MSTKRLTRRQAKWALALANYNFQITYRLGTQNRKADALTRRLGDFPNSNNDNRQQEQIQVLLGPERISQEVRDQLELAADTEDYNTSNPRYLVAPIFIEEPLRIHLTDEVLEAQNTDETCVQIKKAIINKERLDPKKEVQLSLYTI